jgi:hypothetical protein
MTLADQSWYIESAFGTKRPWVQIPATPTTKRLVVGPLAAARQLIRVMVAEAR